jgi:hypothetical protein
MTRYDFHELANFIPLMSEDEFAVLKEDIKSNNLRDPIVLFENKILDGRNRYNACSQLESEGIRTFKDSEIYSIYDSKIDGESQLDYVLSKIKRRNLNTSQLACIAVDIEPAFIEDALKRKQTGTKVETNMLREPDSLTIKGKSVDLAANSIKNLGEVSGRYVADAKKIKEENPEMFKKIKEGKLLISQAKRLIQKEAKKMLQQNLLSPQEDSKSEKLATNDYLSKDRVFMHVQFSVEIPRKFYEEQEDIKRAIYNIKQLKHETFTININ